MDNNLKKVKVFAIVLFLSALCFLTSAFCYTAYAAVPHLINYQGRLTDASGAPLNSSPNITFRIYDAESAGSLLWQGTYNNVPVTKGIFNILLGDINDSGYNFQSLAFDKPYWLEIKVGTDEPMKPRQRITSAGYAIRTEKAEVAANAEKLNNQPASYYLTHNNLSGLSNNDHPQYVRSKTNNERIERGNLVAQRGSSATTVNFNMPFSETPTVVCTAYYDGTERPHYQVYLTSVLTTGFTIKNTNDQDEAIHWIAIGK